LKTTSVVGIGTTTPHDNAEINGGLSSVTRLRIANGNSQGFGQTNAGIRLATGDGVSVWSLAAIYNAFAARYFQLFDEINSFNAITINQTQVNDGNDFMTIHGSVFPALDNSFSFGQAGDRWTALWAVNGTIQTSDVRQKTNVKNLSYGLNELLQLRPVSFNWKAGEDSRLHFGLIAQEVEKVVPELVVHGKTKDDPLGMNYSELVPLLISAVKTQQAVINRQEQRIEALEHRHGIAAGAATTNIGTGLALGAVPILGLGLVWRARKRRPVTS